jgi:hypothetical protein
MLAADKPLPFRLRFELPEFKLPERLPSDSDALKALLIEQRHAMAELQRVAHEHFASLYEQIALMRLRQFGPSSEAMPGQARLFDEAEALAAQPCDGTAGDAAGDEDPPQDPTTIHAQAQNKPARGKRAPLPAELARVEIVHEVPEAERTCPCGTPMVVIGEEVSEQLDIVPMKVQVLRHIPPRANMTCYTYP